MKFNYNNYIGEHMSEPLRVKYAGRGEYKLLGYWTPPKENSYFEGDNDSLVLSNKKGEWNHMPYYLDSGIIPYLKSPADLTDEEWLFVFDAKEGYICRDYSNASLAHTVKTSEFTLKYNEFFLESNNFRFCNQQILNCLYSLHCHPNAEELIKNNLAIRKES